MAPAAPTATALNRPCARQSYLYSVLSRYELPKNPKNRGSAPQGQSSGKSGPSEEQTWVRTAGKNKPGSGPPGKTNLGPDRRPPTAPRPVLREVGAIRKTNLGPDRREKQTWVRTADRREKQTWVRTAGKNKPGSGPPTADRPEASPQGSRGHQKKQTWVRTAGKNKPGSGPPTAGKNKPGSGPPNLGPDRRPPRGQSSGKSGPSEKQTWVRTARTWVRTARPPAGPPEPGSGPPDRRRDRPNLGPDRPTAGGTARTWVRIAREVRAIRKTNLGPDRQPAAGTARTWVRTARPPAGPPEPGSGSPDRQKTNLGPDRPRTPNGSHRRRVKAIPDATFAVARARLRGPGLWFRGR